MSYVKEIDAPFSLATLAQPRDRVKGRILATEVYSFSGIKKRKRPEIAVSTDGDGISIYSIQDSCSVAYYAVPPQAYFTCSPHSTYKKATGSRNAHRLTYVATAQSSNNCDSPKITCFEEQTKPNFEGSVQTHIYDIPKERAAVHKIEVIPRARGETGGAASQDVLVFYEDTTIDCLVASLDKRLWTARLAGFSGDTMASKDGRLETIQSVTICDAFTARKGFLKDRDDIAAMLGAGHENERDLLRSTPLLFIVTRADDEASGENPRFQLHSFSCPAAPPDLLSSQRQNVQHLVSWLLPISHSSETAPLSIQVHAESGTIQQFGSTGVISYQVRGLSAKRVSCLKPSGGPLASAVKLTSTLTLACSSHFCGLFDLKFNSLQASLRRKQIQASADMEKKRKRTMNALDLSTLKLFSYQPSLEMVVGLTHTELVGISMSSVLPARKYKTNESLLVDAIGRGIASRPVAYSMSQIRANKKSAKIRAITASENPTAGWQQRLDHLDALAGASDVVGFESVFAEAVGIERDQRALEDSYPTSDQTLANGTISNGTLQLNGQMDVDKSVPNLPKWTYPENFWREQRFAHRPLALFAISKIFKWTKPQDEIASKRQVSSSIEITFLPPNVFNYLLVTECLSRDMIEKSLQQYGNPDDEVRKLAEGDVTAAIFNCDSQLRLLHSVLNSDAYLDISEITQAVRLLVQRLDTKALPLPQLASHLLTNGDSEESDAHLEYAMDDMEALIENAQSALEHGALILTQCFQPALTKLHSFPTSRITSTLRKMLTHHEMIFLIQLLRLQLRDGGWISRYFIDTVELDDVSNEEEPFDHAILIFANILSSVLDAVGTGGWLQAAQQTPSTSVDAPDDLLYGLRQEVSAALEGIHEATFMKGLLSEFLRFGERAQNARGLPTKEALQAKGKPILLVTNQEANPMTDKVLPLSLRPREKISPLLARQSGRPQRKSQRRIGLEISMQVPNYSIETVGC